MLRWLDPRFSTLWPLRALRQNPAVRRTLGFQETIWTRKVSDEEVRRLVAPLQPSTLSALEISGRVWREDGFREYTSTAYPEFDIMRDTLPARFDLVIAEHIFEHLTSPGRAARNVLAMLKPGGHFLVVTPFLYAVHPDPVDCTRWTETGLAHFLADNGFPLETIVTGSWGNRAVVQASFRRDFRLFNRHVHSIRNEPQFPIVVWALARAG